MLNLLNSMLENTMEGTLKHEVVEIIMDQVDGLDNNEILSTVEEIVTYGCQSGIVSALITYNDEYFVLRDIDEYAEAQQKINNLYKDKIKWNKMSLVNIALSGRFSADRAINEYAEHIWNAQKM